MSAIPKKLLDEISRWMDEGRYGHLQINFSGGKIVNVNRVESIKVEAIGVFVGTTEAIVSHSIDIK